MVTSHGPQPRSSANARFGRRGNFSWNSFGYVPCAASKSALAYALACSSADISSGSTIRFIRESALNLHAEAEAFQTVPAAQRPDQKSGPPQYFGTLGSISSAHAAMPPLTLFAYLKPCSFKNCTALSERTPLLQ